MSTTSKEADLIKLDILRALARSQHALASMMENLAAVMEDGTEAAEHHSGVLSLQRITRHLDVIARHQRILTEKVTGIRLSRMKRGKAGRVWLCRSVTGTAGAGRTADGSTAAGSTAAARAAACRKRRSK